MDVEDYTAEDIERSVSLESDVLPTSGWCPKVPDCIGQIEWIYSSTGMESTEGDLSDHVSVVSEDVRLRNFWAVKTTSCTHCACSVEDTCTFMAKSNVL